MIFYKLLSLALICTGTVSLVGGLAQPAEASTDCTGENYWEATSCFIAHPELRHQSLGISIFCGGSGSDCGPLPESQCGTLEGYQLAVKGECGVNLENSEAVGCTEDAVSTFIPLYYFDSHCGIRNGICLCVMTHQPQHPVQYAEVCDCVEEL